MATAATLVLLDYLGANVNYQPVVIKTGDQATYVDRTNAVLAAQSKFSMFYRESLSTRKVQGKLTYPVLNATTGVLSHTLIGTFEFVIPLIATLIERQQLRKRLVSAIGTTVVLSAVDDGETPW